MARCRPVTPRARAVNVSLNRRDLSAPLVLTADSVLAALKSCTGAMRSVMKLLLDVLQLDKLNTSRLQLTHNRKRIALHAAWATLRSAGVSEL